MIKDLATKEKNYGEGFVLRNEFGLIFLNLMGVRSLLVIFKTVNPFSLMVEQQMRVFQPQDQINID